MNRPERTPSAPLRCESWSDHVWGAERLITNGTHPTMGAYQLFKIVCERCHGSRMETRWLHEPSSAALLNPEGRQ